jgi:hypothetical protein
VRREEGAGRGHGVAWHGMALFWTQFPWVGVGRAGALSLPRGLTQPWSDTLLGSVLGVRHGVAWPSSTHSFLGLGWGGRPPAVRFWKGGRRDFARHPRCGGLRVLGSAPVTRGKRSRLYCVGATSPRGSITCSTTHYSLHGSRFRCTGKKIRVVIEYQNALSLEEASWLLHRMERKRYFLTHRAQ